MAPQLSIILPTRDRPEALRKALISVTRQRGPDIQTVVVNDDGAPVDRVLAEFAGALNLILVTSPRTAGTAGARNLAVEAADGEYLAFLDDDDLYLPGYLESALAVLTTDEADLVYPMVGVSRHWVDPTDPAPPGLPHTFDFPFHDRFLSILNFIPPSGVVVRADRVDRLTFDADLPLLEDWDMWLRLSRDRGYRFRLVNRMGVVYHRIPAHGHSADPVGDGRRALGRFHQLYRRMCDRWPVPATSPEASYRGLVRRVYELAFTRYDDGQLLEPFWYERMVRLLYEGFASGLPADALAPKLAALVEQP